MRPESTLCLGLHEGRHDVGHFGNASGRGVFRLSSSISAGVQTPAERNQKWSDHF